MIGEILNAVLNEVKELLSGTGASVMFKTDFKPSKIPDFSGNFVLLDLEDGVDTTQYPGGLTRCDYQFGFNSYNFEPDAYVDDPTNYSTTLLNFIDTIRQHFSKSLPGALPISGDTNLWLTQAMTDIFNTYGFFFTLTGIFKADALDQDGTIFGFKIGFISTSFDPITSFTENDIVLQTITQVNNPPFNPSKFLVTSNGDFLVTSNGDFLVTT